MCLREIQSQWKLREGLRANRIRIKMEDREAEREKVEHQKTQRLFPGLTKTVKSQAGLECPGLQRCLEASNPFYLVALGPPAFPTQLPRLLKRMLTHSVAGFAKLSSLRFAWEVWEEILKDVKQGEKKENMRHFAVVTCKAGTKRKHSVELQHRSPLPTEPQLQQNKK